MDIRKEDPPKSPTEPVLPSTVAEQVPEIPVPDWPNVTLPKSARGSIPVRDEGASAIHSAENRAAEKSTRDRTKDRPVVVSFILRVNFPPANWTSANIRSPGLAGIVGI